MVSAILSSFTFVVDKRKEEEEEEEEEAESPPFPATTNLSPIPRRTIESTPFSSLSLACAANALQRPRISINFFPTPP